MNSLTSKIKNLKSWLIDVRRDLHKTPELGLEEFLTKENIILLSISFVILIIIIIFVVKTLKLKKL